MLGTLSKQQKDSFELCFRLGTCFRTTDTQGNILACCGIKLDSYVICILSSKVNTECVF